MTIDSPNVWTIELRKRWEALLHEILVDGNAKRTVKELTEECKTLILITAWFKSRGNLTSAAELRGSSRRDIRERVTAWHEANPQILLQPKEATPTKTPTPTKTKTRKTRPPKNDEGQPSEAGPEAATPAAEEPSRDTEDGPT